MFFFCGMMHQRMLIDVSVVHDEEGSVPLSTGLLKAARNLLRKMSASCLLQMKNSLYNLQFYVCVCFVPFLPLNCLHVALS